MSDTVDLRSTITELCKRAGLDKKNVKAITITSQDATFEVFAEDAKGKLYLDPQTNDLALGAPVTVPIQF